MKPVISSVFVSAGLALLMIGSAQAVEEYRCLGSGTFIGRVLNSTTIRTRHSVSTAVGGAVCHGFIEPGAIITVQFESPSASMSVGKRVKLKVASTGWRTLIGNWRVGCSRKPRLSNRAVVRQI